MSDDSKQVINELLDPTRQRLIELLDQLIEIKNQTREIQTTWEALWEDPKSNGFVLSRFKELSYFGTLIYQLADQFGLNEEVKNDDPETRH